MIPQTCINNINHQLIDYFNTDYYIFIRFFFSLLYAPAYKIINEKVVCSSFEFISILTETFCVKLDF